MSASSIFIQVNSDFTKISKKFIWIFLQLQSTKTLKYLIIKVAFHSTTIVLRVMNACVQTVTRVFTPVLTVAKLFSLTKEKKKSENLCSEIQIRM